MRRKALPEKLNGETGLTGAALALEQIDFEPTLLAFSARHESERAALPNVRRILSEIVFNIEKL